MTTADRQDFPHAVYHFHDGSGRVIYVGVTGNLPSRIRSHERDKPWWREVATISVIHHPTRIAALRQEAHDIRRFRPRYNVAGKPHGPPAPRGTPRKAMTPEQILKALAPSSGSSGP